MDIMIDLETLSLQPNAVVVSVGWVPFEPSENYLISDLYETSDYRTLDTAEQQRKGLHVDAATVQWWMGQPEGVRAETFMGNFFSSNREVITGLARDFDHWLFDGSGNPTGKLWCSGAGFDWNVIKSLFKAYDVQLPVLYSQVRDCSTWKDAARLRGWIAPERATAHFPLHHAKWDALWQTKEILSAYQYLRVL